MAKKITSHNQSGGITAEKVHVENTINAPDINIEPSKVKKNKTTWAKVLGLLVALATIVSCVIALLQYLGIGDMP